MRKTIALFTVALFCLSGLAMGAGLGISPSIVEMDNLLRGNSYEKYYKLLNLEDYEKEVEVTPSGDAASWTNVLDAETREERSIFTIPANEQLFFLAEFDVPEDAPNDMYEGFFDVVPTKQREAGETQVSLVVRGFYRLEVTGVEDINGDVDSITVKDTESGQLLRINFDFRNTGNVKIAPTADVDILKDGEVIDSFTQDGNEVPTGKFEVQEVTWDTENRGTGDFQARVKILLAGEEIASKTLGFNIKSRGTYTAEGRVGEVSQPPVWKAGQLGKTQVKFYNTGQIDVQAKVKGEVKRDGEIVDIVEGDEKLVKAGSSRNLEFYYKPDKPGEYIIASSVLYSGKEEPVSELRFEVSSAEDAERAETVNTESFGSDDTNYVLLTILGALVVVLLGVAVLFAFLFFKKKH